MQEPSVDPTPSPRPDRRFGSHLGMRWWVPILLVVGLPLGMVVVQLLLYGAAAAIEGDNARSDLITPLQLLAVNLSVGLTGVLAVPLVARAARVPWRTVISFPRRPDARRLVHYALIMVVVMALANVVAAVLAPGATGWTGLGFSGTTAALLAVVVLTIPLQSAAEELMFRGAIMPAAASWVRSAVPALVVGVVVSTLAFAATHGSADPWLSGYYAFVGLCAAMMAIISRGLEAPVAFHVAHNLVAMTLTSVLSDGGGWMLDRSVGAGGPYVLIAALFNLVAVAAVWFYEHRQSLTAATGRARRSGGTARSR